MYYVILTAFCIAAIANAQPNYVWWEGELPRMTNFPQQTSFSASTFEAKRHLLSNGEWLTNEGPRGADEAFAIYSIQVPHGDSPVLRQPHRVGSVSEATYHFWTRKFWKHGPFKWRFDSQDWRVCGRDIALADDTYIREHLGANWVYLGQVELSQGEHRFELRLLAEEGESLTACFDAFLLTTQPFMPNGNLKPGEKWFLADPGYFAFGPSPDTFSDTAALDLRGLNERFAGEHGFIKRDGLNFTLGNGEPVRFWGVNLSSNTAGQDRASIDYLARRLAKLGVNAARYHSPIFDDSVDPANVDAEKLDNLFYLVAALKREGIYTTLSFYFPLWFDIRPRYGITGYEAAENKKPFALLYFEPRMQAIYRSWARHLLTTENPYTGVTLADDPAIAVVEIINEDSYFFWTFSRRNVPDVHWEQLEKLYGAWLTERYGTLESAFAAWGDAQHENDDPQAGRAGLYEAWHMTTEGAKSGGPAKTRRVGDQVRFLTENQRAFYTDTIDYFRSELGVKSLISPSNWHVSDAAMLDALERYTYTAGEVIDRHGYFGGEHKGDGASYSVRVGHTFKDRAAVTAPEGMPFQVIQIDPYPHIISEIGWTNPNRFRADSTFLCSAYGALQGIDGFFFFAVGSNFMNDGVMRKFTASSPVIAGSFPAAALQYRRGDVAEAEDVVYQIVSLDDLYAMKGSGISTAQALDEFRRQDIPPGGEVTGAVNMLDPLSYYVGRVTRTFGQDPSQSRQKDLTQYIDRQNQVVRSLTGELRWNYGDGLALVDTPKSQGAAGFLSKAGKIALSNVTIESNNEFAAVMVISLDDQSLKDAKRILIQAMTEEQPYGFKSENGTITDLGSAPIGVKEIEATVSLKLNGTGRPKVIALDENGYATETRVETSGDGIETPLVISLTKDAIYHLVTR